MELEDLVKLKTAFKELKSIIVEKAVLFSEGISGIIDQMHDDHFAFALPMGHYKIYIRSKFMLTTQDFEDQKY